MKRNSCLISAGAGTGAGAGARDGAGDGDGDEESVVASTDGWPGIGRGRCGIACRPAGTAIKAACAQLATHMIERMVEKSMIDFAGRMLYWVLESVVWAGRSKYVA